MDVWAGRGCTPITLNKYLYANQSPVGFIDPSGYMTLSLSMGGSFSVSLSSIATASAGLALASILYPSLENSVKTTIWDVIVASQISHSVPQEAYDAMARAETKAKDKNYKSDEKHHTIPMYLCGHADQDPLALVSYAEHQIIHAGLSAVLISIELAGDNAADMLNIPLGRRRSPTITAIGRTQMGRSAIASAIGTFYMVTGTSGYGGGGVERAFGQVRGPFVRGLTWCK